MAEKLNVAAYARVSTDKEDQVNSLTGQRIYFTDFIRHHEDWQLVQVYYDEGISGTGTKKRSGFNQMICDALHGEIDLILTKEVCRFARNTVDTLFYTRKLKEANVGVIFTIDNIDTRDSDGELRLTIMASIAQEESRKTSERVKWGQQRRMEQGVVFGRDLVGYTVQNGKLKINEEEVPIVRAVFHKYTNEGKGTTVIARELLEEGMRPKRMASWSNVVILRMLKNEKYVGDLCQKKTFTPNYLTHAKKYNHSEEGMVYIRNHHAPIIDRELWDRTQKELQRRAVFIERREKYSNRYWCSGKLYCGECGRRYVGKTKTLKNGTVYRGWRCISAAEHGARKRDIDGREIGCSNGQIHEKALLSCMQYAIAQIPVDKKQLQEEIITEIRQLKATSAQNMDSARIQKQIDELQRKKRKLLDLALEEILDQTDFKTQNAWYNEKIRTLEVQLQHAKEEEKSCQKQLDSMEQYRKAMDEIMEFGESNVFLFREILDRIVIYQRDRLVIWLKAIPFGVELKIHSHGRGRNFTTDILESRYV